MTTISDLLFESQADAAGELAAAIGRTPQVLSRLSVGGLSIPGLDVANAITALLELPIGNIAVKAWKEHRNIVEAKQRTALNPESREVVRLLEHRIKSKTEPVIEADLNGIGYPLLQLTLEVELRLSTADVIVHGGEVSDVRAGSSTAKATLSVSKVVLASKQFRELDLKREIEELKREGLDPDHQRFHDTDGIEVDLDDDEGWPPPPGAAAPSRGVPPPPRPGLAPPQPPPPPSRNLVTG